jgi:dUTP pyrophosphatase
VYEIFDIPESYSIRLHPRSGLALKQGLTLANCEGVIDSDYINPLFVAILSTSAVEATIKDGDRIAQLELVLNVNASIVETYNPPQQKSSRTGGFGSTGV